MADEDIRALTAAKAEAATMLLACAGAYSAFVNSKKSDQQQVAVENDRAMLLQAALAYGLADAALFNATVVIPDSDK
jgi:hypothetical protein